MKDSRRKELMAETYETMAGWLRFLVNTEEGEISQHFQDEMDFNNMTEEEVLFCQKIVKSQILALKEAESGLRELL